MMKGFFRGLRCLFGDTDHEKEPEIQIGAPTDVKHVAHIGCDGPSTPAPSWMNGYQSGSESQPGNTNAGSKDMGSAGDPHKAKQSRRSSHGHESSNHKSRKNKTSNNESSVNESSRTRRPKNSFMESESTAQETNVKKTRKKQGEGTTRSSKTRNKDLSTIESGCSDGVCQKPHD